MRRLTCISLVIALSACIPISFNTGGSKRGPQVGTSNPITKVAVAMALVSQIRAALARVRDEIPKVRARLHPVSCESQQCYAAGEVEAAIAKIRRDVQAAFPEEALASRISLDDEIAQLGTFAAMETASSIQLVRSGPATTSPAYDGRAVDTAFQRIRQMIERYLAHEVLNPTIHITSDPDRATFEMQVAGNVKTRRETLTNNELQSVWRGRYSGRVHKQGFRDAKDFPVDLMNDRRTKLSCKLVAIAADASEESNCWLEK